MAGLQRIYSISYRTCTNWGKTEVYRGTLTADQQVDGFKLCVKGTKSAGSFPSFTQKASAQTFTYNIDKQPQRAIWS